MYHVRIYKNWNNSNLTPESWSHSPLEFLHVSGDYGIKVKDTADGDIVWVDNSLARFDPIKYIGVDFFMSEPRDATLTFLKDSDGWLEDTFKEPNELNEINHTVYYNDDGDIIDWEDEYNGIDPMKNISETLCNEIIYEKEVIVQQISKYVIQIYLSLPGIDDQVMYTGFVDKSKTSMNDRTIKIQCIDIIGLIGLFSSVLINVIPGDDDEYRYISSHSILDEFIDKVKNMTKLNIEINNDILNYHYIEYNYIGMQINLANEEISFNDQFWTQVGSLDSGIFASDELDCFIIYKPFLAYDIDFDDMYDTYDLRVYIIYKKYTYDADALQFTESSTIIVHYGIDGYTTYENPNPPTIDKYIGEIENCVLSFKNTLRSSNSYYDDDSELICSLYKLSNGIYDAMVFNQDRYGVAIPVYSGTYTYEELFKTILYLNKLCIHGDQYSEIQIIKKDEFENGNNGSTIININTREILSDGYSQNSIERDEYSLSNNLDIIWWDDTLDGSNVTELNSILKSEYSEIFIHKYPLEINCKILRKNILTNVNRDIVIGNKLNMLGSMWVVIMCQLNDTGFYYDIKAYKLNVPIQL